MAQQGETAPLQLIMSNSQGYRLWLSRVGKQFKDAGVRIREETALAVPQLDASDGALEEGLIAVRQAMIEGNESVVKAAADAQARVQAEVDKVCALLGTEEAPLE
ncbi:hypothetical protein ACFQ61_08580 [Streptomyces sp. NPDC056500]|uniref:hypothetical protein n=1 Tax=Streptomyces sp. NPDC056500 TaxID=3345840 RepID=UPI0036778C41